MAPNTTALSRIPLASGPFGELDAQLAQSPPCPFGVALPRRGVAALGSLDLRGGPLQQFLWRAEVQPPERDQCRDRGVHLALRQLRIFPPRIPVASATGTGSSRHSGSGGVSNPGSAGPRTGPGRSRSSDP